MLFPKMAYLEFFVGKSSGNHNFVQATWHKAFQLQILFCGIVGQFNVQVTSDRSIPVICNVDLKCYAS